MIKNIIFYGCLLVLCSSYIFKSNQTLDNDKIIWSSKRKLFWDDFKGIPDTSSTNIQAITTSQIVITESYMINGIPKYVVECQFIKSKSWTKVNDESTLKHEQLHFDIDELFTRKIRKAFDSLNVKKVNDYNIYNNIYYFFESKCEEYQVLYDNEVYFNEIQQRKWTNKIQNELTKLKKYEQLEVR